MDRRQVLVMLAGGSMAGVAGCAGGGDGDGDGEATTTDTTSSTTTTPTPTDTTTTTTTTTTTATPTPGPGNYDAETVRSEATTVGYDELFRNIESYKADSIHFEFGQIYQTIYEDEYTYLQLYVANNDRNWEGDIAASYWGDERLLENDVIELWAVVEQLYEYETTQGNTRSIPLVTIVDYELYEDVS